MGCGVVGCGVVWCGLTRSKAMEKLKRITYYKRIHINLLSELQPVVKYSSAPSDLSEENIQQCCGVINHLKAWQT